MRIALLTHSVLPRGGVVHTLELAEALAARGHMVTVIAPAEAGQSLFRATSVPVHIIDQPAVAGSIVEQVRQRIDALVRGLPSVLAQDRFDLLHAQDSLNGNALATLAASGELNCPWLRTVHHLDDFEQQQLRDWQERGWRYAAAIGCVSDLWCQHFASTHGTAAARLYNGVNLERFTSHGPRHSDERYVLALGGVEGRKNTLRLLKAFASMHRHDADWCNTRLIIAGGASLLDHSREHTAWADSIKQLGLREGPGQAVQRLGPISDAELPQLMRGALCVAMPSLAEGFGLVALESLACGTPVLVSNRPPFTEHLADSQYVAWCDPEDVNSIAKGLARASTLLRPSALPTVCAEHAWSRSAAVHETWYKCVLNRRVARTKQEYSLA